MQKTGKSKRSQKKFFTVESANKMLPLVRSITSDVVERFRELEVLRERLEILQNSRRERLSQAHREEVEEVERDFDKVKDDLVALMEELRGLGVEFKGPEGLVDFPALLDNREIYLCWKVGEPEVMYWHERDAGFTGRQHLTPKMAIGRSHN